MKVERDPTALRRWVRERRTAGARIGFVPTMGALHEGHLRLVDRATARCDHVVTSVFVNPLQFGPSEDLDAYPRNEARDRALLEGRGVDVVFLPGVDVMYPDEPLVRPTAPAMTRTLCGPHRPGHFEGVLTVVAKLFHLCEPDLAVFGRKDAQQAALIRRMVRDLDFPLEVEVAPTVREADGLAMSSRNAYLGDDERAAALTLSRALDAGHAAWQGGVTAAAAILAAARGVLAGEETVRVQYVEVVDPDTLAPLTAGRDDVLLAVAAFLGRTRLIDNVVLGAGLAGDIRVA